MGKLFAHLEGGLLIGRLERRGCERLDSAPEYLERGEPVRSMQMAQGKCQRIEKQCWQLGAGSWVVGELPKVS